MLKINMVGGISHLPLFAPDDDKKSAVQEERDKIEVENSEGSNNQEEKEEDVKASDEDKDDKKEEKEEVEEKVEAKEEELDDLKDEKKEAKTQAEKDRIQRRIDRLTGERNEARKRITQLEAQLAAKPDDEKVLTEDEVERRAEEKAEIKRLNNLFAEDCQKLADEGKKLDKKFHDKIDLMAEEVGKIPSQMIGILADLPNGSGVLLQIASDLDIAEEIYKLSPARMAIRLARISDELIAKSKKQISKVPEPKEKVGGKGDTPEVRATEKDDMDTFVKKRNIEAENHRRRKQGLPPLSLQ